MRRRHETLPGVQQTGLTTAYFSARNRRTIDAVCTSTISIVPFAPPITRFFPSAVNIMPTVVNSRSRRDAFSLTSSPRPKDASFVSNPALASSDPSGENARFAMLPNSWLRVRISFPDESHKRICSVPEEAIRRPSVLTARTGCGIPASRRRTAAPVVRARTSMAPSANATMISSAWAKSIEIGVCGSFRSCSSLPSGSDQMAMRSFPTPAAILSPCGAKLTATDFVGGLQADDACLCRCRQGRNESNDDQGTVVETSSALET